MSNVHIASDKHCFAVRELLQRRYATVVPGGIQIMDVAGALVAYRIAGHTTELWVIVGRPCGFGWKHLTPDQHRQAIAYLTEESKTWQAPNLTQCAGLIATMTTARSPNKPATRGKH